MNNYNQHNQYGNNIMNFGPQPRELDTPLKQQLRTIIHSGSIVKITSVLGDGEAYGFANQIKTFLENEGYQVDGVNQAIYSGPITGQIIEPPQGEDKTFKIIIGNKQ